jgi:hypothetical protein
MRIFFIFLPVAVLLLLAACQSSPKDLSHGAMVRGGYPAVAANDEIPGLNRHYADARELKLKVRELAEQLVADMRDCSLQGIVALPTSFVDLNDFRRTSAFGRLMAEQLFYELNQRGYPVREYRHPGFIRGKPGGGEYALSRELGSLSTKSGAVVIVGTYSNAGNAVFVNARLVHPRDGRVLRTANLVLESNPTVLHLLQASAGSGTSFGGTTPADGRGSSPKSSAGTGTMRIRDFDAALYPPRSGATTPFDQGEDIH